MGDSAEHAVGVRDHLIDSDVVLILALHREIIDAEVIADAGETREGKDGEQVARDGVLGRKGDLVD
jgi:hypothetical protein